MKRLSVILGFRIEYDEVAVRQLEKMDSSVVKQIIAWLDERLNNCSNPLLWGKALKGNRFGNNWCYRVGDYRILSTIQDDKLIIVVVEFGHRKEVYQKNKVGVCMANQLSKYSSHVMGLIY